MATAEESGAAADNTASSYGAVGVGGKFRKMPLRRQTPYDRPSIAIRGTSTINSSWLTKLVVDPASKIIAYGADRLIPSIFRKRLHVQLSSPPQSTDAENDAIVEVQGEILNNNQDSARQPPDGDVCQPVSCSRSNCISELELLLKRKRLSRLEIVHLSELLQSRVVEESQGNDSPKDVDKTLDFARREQFSIGPLEENRNEGIISSSVISTRLPNSRVLVDEMASPAEIAKAYMCSRPSKVSPKALGVRHQISREDAGLLCNRKFTNKTYFGQAAPENNFRTQSRGRSAIYRMARTSYSRVHPASIYKGNRIGSNDNTGPSMMSSARILVENYEKFPSGAMSLKRRSSVMDDELGSVGYVRRIRQKSNLLAPGIHHISHGVGSGSRAKQKLQLIAKPGHKFSGETDNGSSIPSTSYDHVPSNSSEVAARILQNLERLTPNKKSPVSKLLDGGEKSPLKLTPSMGSDQALRSKEVVAIAPLKMTDDHESGDVSNVTLPNVRNSSPQKPRMAEENGQNLPSGTWNPTVRNDRVVPFRFSRSITNTTDPIVEDGATIPPQTSRAFMMCAQEEILELDGVHNNRLKPTFSVRTQSMEASLMDLRKIEQSTTTATSSVINFSASEVASRATESALIPLAAAKFDTPKEASSLPLLSDRFPAVSGKNTESVVESSKSLVNISASVDTEVKILELDNVGHLNHMVGPDTTNGPVLSRISSVLNTTSDQNPSPPGDAFQLTASTSVSNLTPAGTTTISSNPSGSIFGLAAKPLNSVGTSCKFGSSEDPATAVSAASTPITSEVATQRIEVELNPMSGSTSSSHFSVTTTAATGMGSSSFGLGSFISHSTSDNLQSSIIGDATKSLVSDSGTSTLGTSIPPVASASLLSFGINNTSGSSFNFGSSSSSDNMTFVPVNESTSVSVKIGASPVSDGNAVGTTLGSSSSTNAVAPSTGLSALFSFGDTSSGTSIFSFRGNSSTSPALNVHPVISNSAPNPSLQSLKPLTFGSDFSSSPTMFSFGPSSSSGPALLLMGFTFGASSSAATAISSLPSTGASFGAPSTQSVPATSSPTGFSFGAPSTVSVPATSSPTGFSFGAPSTQYVPATSSPTGFSFGAPSTLYVPATPSPNVFSFGASSTLFAPAMSLPSFSSGESTTFSTTNAVPVMFNPSAGASPTPFSSSTSASTSVVPSPSLPNSHTIFSSAQTTSGFTFTALTGNNDQQQMSVSEIGQSSISASPPGFAFGSETQSQSGNPFMLGAQQTAADSFSLGSGGGVSDKSGRKFVKISRTKYRKR